MAILEVKNLNLGFECECGFRQALFDVSFELECGKMHALVGESGCGKSISAMSILRLLPKTAKMISGEIFYNGENLLTNSLFEPELSHPVPSSVRRLSKFLHYNITPSQ